MNESRSQRIVVFGATGRVGEQVLSQLEETDWPIAEILGVVSADSTAAEFEFFMEDADSQLAILHPSEHASGAEHASREAASAPVIAAVPENESVNSSADLGDEDHRQHSRVESSWTRWRT